MTCRTVSIGATCCPTGVRNPHSDASASFRYVDISTIDRAQKLIRSAPEVKSVDAPSRARQEIHEGDILVATVRPNLNAVAMVPKCLHREIASTGFCVLRPNNSLVLGRYLFHFVRTPQFIQELVSQARGANYPAVSDADVKTVGLPLPPLSEQHRIVEILDQADALRKKRAEADAKAARIPPALFHKMFGDPATNPMGWPVKSLEELGATVRYGLGQPPRLSANGLPLIRATNISRGTILLDDMLRVDPQDVPIGKRAFLKAEEVLVVRSGAYTGDAAQVTSQWEGAVAGYDLVVTPGQSLTGGYVESYILTSFVQQSYFQDNKSRAGQSHLNAQQLLLTPFLQVPYDLQQQFSSRLARVRVLRKHQESLARSLEKCFGVLLMRAFSGDLTRKWRESHMKELLAEMEIQARYLEPRL